MNELTTKRQSCPVNCGIFRKIPTPASPLRTSVPASREAPTRVQLWLTSRRRGCLGSLLFLLLHLDLDDGLGSDVLAKEHTLEVDLGDDAVCLLPSFGECVAKSRDVQNASAIGEHSIVDKPGAGMEDFYIRY